MNEQRREPPPSWMDSLPNGWVDARLKDAAHPPRVRTHVHPTRYVGMEHVEAHRGIANPVALPPEVSTSNDVRTGTICFGKLRPYLAKAFIAQEPLAVSTEFLLLTPNTGIADPEFLGFLLISKGFTDNLNDEVSGAKMPRVDWGILSSRRIPLPDLLTQRKVVARLKRELSFVDQQVGLLTRRRELISQLKRSLREEVIFSRGPAPIEQSEEPRAWYGPIPSGWTIERLGNLFRPSSRLGGDGLPILSVSIHSGISDKELGDAEQDRKVVRSEDRGLYKRVIPGDIVYNQMRAWQGGFGVVKVDGLVSPAYVVARPKRNVVPAFVEHVLRTASAIEEMRRRSRGIIDFRLRLYWDEFKDICIPLPPLVEQQRLAEELSHRLRIIEQQSQAMDRIQSLLAQQRRCLIHEAVTGKTLMTRDALAVDRSSDRAAA